MNLSIPQRLTEVALLFLKQGFTAFAGPAVHIAMMHDETVTGVNVIARIELAAHWPSDVAVSYLIGLLWVTLLMRFI